MAILITHLQVPDNLAMPLCVSGVVWVVKSHFGFVEISSLPTMALKYCFTVCIECEGVDWIQASS